MDKKLLKWNLVFQYGWVITNILNSILLLPLYLKNIDAATLGVWLATGAVLGWMTLVDPGVGEVLQQRIAELRGRNEKGAIGKLIGSGYLASGFVLLISVALGLGCYFFLNHLVNKNVSDYPYLSEALIITVMATGLSLVSFTISGINQGLHNAQQVAICSLTANFLFLFTNLIFLFLGYGVLSIALANLVRAVYINIHNIIAMNRTLQRDGVRVHFNWMHFRHFIRIFSFTSASKILTGLANSVDMIVLGRFISPAMITVYEVNRRPISIVNSLIGRHSVALMPLVSHAKGKSDKEAIVGLINQHFKFYMYAALFAALLFSFNHHDLIAAWTGPGQQISSLLLYLLVGQFFFSLTATFMSNIAYALGDIKRVSLYSIIRNIFYALIMYLAARFYGITGAVVASLLVAATADFIFYYYRVYKLGYLQLSLLTHLSGTWLVVLPLALLGGWALSYSVDTLLPFNMHFTRLLVNGGVFSFYFLMLLLFIDAPVRKRLKGLGGKYIAMPLSRLKRA